MEFAFKWDISICDMHIFPDPPCWQTLHSVYWIKQLPFSFFPAA